MKQAAHSTLEAMPGRAGPSPNLLVANLSRFVSLSKDDISFLETLCEKQERVQKAVNLAEEGDAPSRGFANCGGLACRYRDMPDGRRQILTFIMPGDFFGLHAFLMKSIDYSIIALTPTRLCAQIRFDLHGARRTARRVGDKIDARVGRSLRKHVR